MRGRSLRVQVITIDLAILSLALAAPACADDDIAKAARAVRQIVAHRGSSADRPENTLAAYRRAIEAGATATEVDVRTTRDGGLVCLHDADLKRTTGRQALARDLTAAEIQQLDAGGWFGKQFAGERVPTLREALAACRGKIDVLLDLQEAGEDYARRVAAEVRKYGDPRRTVLGVRNVADAKLFRELLPEARQLGLLPTASDIDAFAAAGVATIRLWPKWVAADPALVRRVRDCGVRLHLNGTTGAEDEVRELLRHAPDSLSSDDPARLVATLALIGGVEQVQDGSSKKQGR